MNAPVIPEKGSVCVCVGGGGFKWLVHCGFRWDKRFFVRKGSISFSPYHGLATKFINFHDQPVRDHCGRPCRDDCHNFSEFCVLTNAFQMLQALPVPLLVFIWCQTLYAPKQRTTSPTIAALTNFRKLVCPNMTTENSKNWIEINETEAWVRGDLGSTYVSSAIDCRLNRQNGDFLFEIH